MRDNTPGFDDSSIFEEGYRQPPSEMERAGDALFERVVNGMIRMLFLPYPGAIVLVWYAFGGGADICTPWIFVPTFLYVAGFLGWTADQWEPRAAAALHKIFGPAVSIFDNWAPTNVRTVSQMNSLFSATDVVTGAAKRTVLPWMLCVLATVVFGIVGSVWLWLDNNGKVLRNYADKVASQSRELREKNTALIEAENNLRATKASYEKELEDVNGDLELALDSAHLEHVRAERFASMRLEVQNVSPADNGPLAPVLIDALNGLRDELRGTLDPVPDAG